MYKVLQGNDLKFLFLCGVVAHGAISMESRRHYIKKRSILIVFACLYFPQKVCQTQLGCMMNDM